MLKSIRLAAVFFLLGVVSLSSNAAVRHFKTQLSGSVYQNGKGLPRPKLLGSATLKGNIKIPAYQVFFVDGSNDQPYETSRPKSLYVDKKVNEAFVSRVALYFFYNQWVLVPKDWKFVNAVVGADGSNVIYFAPSGSYRGYFSVWDNGGCFGCGIDAASLYFKEADRLNQSEFGAETAYMKSKPVIKIVDLKKYYKAWRVTVNGQNIDGLAYFNNASGANAQMIEISLPEYQKDLATPILNWYLN